MQRRSYDRGYDAGYRDGYKDGYKAANKEVKELLLNHLSLEGFRQALMEWTGLNKYH